METLKRIKRFVLSDTFGKGSFAIALILTAIATLYPRGSAATPPRPRTPLVTPTGAVNFSATLSQTKLVQNGDGTFYTEICIEPPSKMITEKKRGAVDLVIVLDRSGSMAADNRLPYAKTAIEEVLSRLGAEDRFGLVTFESAANIVTPLSYATETFKSEERGVVRSLSTGGSTNLSSGLELARGMFLSSSLHQPERTRKILLLSDGEANVGIVDPSALATLTRSISSQGAIVSTIGMGLGFNEVLMSSLADHGMGNYAYLEHLASLGEILERDLASSRAVYAANSTLEIELPEGVRLVDASAYPQEPGRDSRHIRLLTGQLVSGVKKQFFLTFSAPTGTVGDIRFGKLELQYAQSGDPVSIRNSNPLVVSVVEKAREREVLSSVDSDILKKSWIMNNLGRIQQQISADMRAGNAPAAQMKLEEYEAGLKATERRYNINLSDEKAKSSVMKMQSTVTDLLNSDGAVLAEKSNRAAKEVQLEGFNNQGR